MVPESALARAAVSAQDEALGVVFHLLSGNPLLVFKGNQHKNKKKQRSVFFFFFFFFFFFSGGGHKHVTPRVVFPRKMITFHFLGMRGTVKDHLNECFYTKRARGFVLQREVNRHALN